MQWRHQNTFDKCFSQLKALASTNDFIVDAFRWRVATVGKFLSRMIIGLALNLGVWLKAF